MDTDDPDADPTAMMVRGRKNAGPLRPQRPAGNDVADRSAAAPPGAQVVLTALARAGLYNLDQDNQQAIQQLDEVTLAYWLERTRTCLVLWPYGAPHGGPAPRMCPPARCSLGPEGTSVGRCGVAGWCGRCDRVTGGALVAPPREAEGSLAPALP